MFSSLLAPIIFTAELTMECILETPTVLPQERQDQGLPGLSNIKIYIEDDYTDRPVTVGSFGNKKPEQSTISHFTALIMLPEHINGNRPTQFNIY